MNAANLAVLGPSERLPSTHQAETSAMIGIVERLARDPSVPMERIQAMMDMVQTLRREEAEEAFNDAMALAQGEMGPIARDSFNKQTQSKYASYHAVDKAIRPIYTKHGLRVSFNEGEEGAPEGHIRVAAVVTKGRHSERYHYDSPIITTGMAGKTMMTLTHARASAVTYAKRYLQGMIWNLSTGEDDDGNADASDTLSFEQIQEVSILAEEVGADRAAFCRYFQAENIAAIKAKDFDRAIAALNKKRGAK